MTRGWRQLLILYLVIATLLLFGLARRIFGDTGQSDKLEGIYSVVGKEGEHDYTGCAIVRKFGEGYIAQFSTAMIEDGATKHLYATQAVGIRDGDRLTLGWKSGEKTVGVTVYKIEKDGSLSGKWLIMPGSGEVRTETLKRLGPAPKVPVRAELKPVAAPLHEPRLPPAINPPKPINLTGQWQSGSWVYKVRHEGEAVSLASETYPAVGHFDHRSNRLTIFWHSCGKITYIGVYILRDEELTGCWANVESGWFDGERWHGTTVGDVMRRVVED